MIKNIVIPLSSLSNRNNDLELRYALRCLPEHENLYIIGRKPELQNIIYIPFRDEPGLAFEAENIYNKILLAFDYVDNFYCWADDYFVSKDFDYNTYYHYGNLEDKLVPETSETYKITIKNTIKYLKDRNMPTRFFNVHAPFRYEKDKLPIIKEWPKYGYALKSLYGNINGISGTKYPDMKIREHTSAAKVIQIANSRLFFSTMDNYITKTFAGALASLWPQASRYELSSPSLSPHNL